LADESGPPFVLDGYPRNPQQARALDALLAHMGSRLDAVVAFDVPEPVLVERLLGRGRSDDTEEVIRRRLEVYREETASLLDFYGDMVVSIDAVGTVEEITELVMDALHARRSGSA
jgi:adenylate kinase